MGRTFVDLKMEHVINTPNHDAVLTYEEFFSIYCCYFQFEYNDEDDDDDDDNNNVDIY